MRLIRIGDVMFKTGLARSTIYKFIKTKGFPHQVDMGGRLAAWVEADIDNWIANQISNSR